MIEIPRSAAEPVGAILSRAWPEMIANSRKRLAAQFMRREIDWKILMQCWPRIPGEDNYQPEPNAAHLKWARKTIAELDLQRYHWRNSPEKLGPIEKLRDAVVVFGAAIEGLGPDDPRGRVDRAALALDRLDIEDELADKSHV